MKEQLSVREIRVDPNVLGAALHVPDGVRVVGCRWDENTKTIMLLLGSCEFEKAEKPNEIPLYDVHFYVHWDWVKVPQEKKD